MNKSPERYVLRHKPTQLYVQVWGFRMTLGAELTMAPLFTEKNLKQDFHKVVHRAAVSKWASDLEKVAVVDLAGTGVPTLA